MKALVLSALFWVVLAPAAAAQQSFGPVVINNDVYGVPVMVRAESGITTKSEGDDLVVDARIVTDLIDLQKKFSDIMKKLPNSTADCANRHDQNQTAIIALKSGSLWPRADQLVVLTKGEIEIWSCIRGRERSAIRWHKKQIASLKLFIPQIQSWRQVSKKQIGTRPFRSNSWIYLGEKETHLSFSKTDIRLEGEEISSQYADLQGAQLDLQQRIKDVLEHAISFDKIIVALLPELRSVRMEIITTRFSDFGGHAIAEFNLRTRLPGNLGTQLFQQAAVSRATD